MKTLETLRKLKHEGGFTLLELLVVVAILAAIAGTATIALQDTDARAAAAAHVAMMDELSKGVHTYRVLNKNVYPDNFDSLQWVATATAGANTAALLPDGRVPADGDILGIESGIAEGPLNLMGTVGAIAGAPTAADKLDEIGMTQLRYINAANAAFADGSVGAGACAPLAGTLQTTVASRNNNMVAGNIFNGEPGNGCGISLDIDATANVVYWTDPIERIIGPGEWADFAFDPTAGATGTGEFTGAKAPVFMVVGFGPSATLFNTNNLGGLTSVPVYRHVREDQYNRFLGLFRIGDALYTGTTNVWNIEPTDQVAFVAIVDGAGDTKEEELGEWDGTRSTI